MNANDADARLQRRALLETANGPATHAEYLVSLSGTLSLPPAGPVTVWVRYVPDRRVVAPQTFGAYLAAVAAAPWPSLEHAAAAILDDINNELVPRWIQVRIVQASGATADPGLPRHDVLLEDQQPKWENPSLLSRLERV
ncbi:MAG: hypothetical protein O3A88_08290 [Proteobacteria bacterium]|nr:hypothetical protein [Pseudomonadota bacterium]